jgi:hypothetical protein
MSKKSLTFMQWPSLSIKVYFPCTVMHVDFAGADEVCIFLEVQGIRFHEGHRISYKTPRILAEGSPLHRLVTEVFGITLSLGDTFDLGVLVGRSCRVKFAPADESGTQKIESIKAAKEAAS